MSPAQQQQFEQFWQAYPRGRRVGKFAAAREWERRKPDLSVVLAALAHQYAAPMELRFIPHPRTWLSQGRWLDEDARAAEPRPCLISNSLFEVADDWFDECQRLHGGRCNGRAAHAIQRQLDALKTGPV